MLKICINGSSKLCALHVQRKMEIRGDGNFTQITTKKGNPTYAGRIHNSNATQVPPLQKQFMLHQIKS